MGRAELKIAGYFHRLFQQVNHLVEISKKKYFGEEKNIYIFIKKYFDEKKDIYISIKKYFDEDTCGFFTLGFLVLLFYIIWVFSGSHGGFISFGLVGSLAKTIWSATQSLRPQCVIGRWNVRLCCVVAAPLCSEYKRLPAAWGYLHRTRNYPL